MKAQIHIVKEQPSLFWMNVTAKLFTWAIQAKKLTLLGQQLLDPFEVLTSSCIHSL